MASINTPYSLGDEDDEDDLREELAILTELLEWIASELEFPQGGTRQKSIASVITNKLHEMKGTKSTVSKL